MTGQRQKVFAATRFDCLVRQPAALRPVTFLAN